MRQPLRALPPPRPGERHPAAAPEPPADVELLTAADFEDDPRPLFDLDAEVTSDEPSDVADEFTDYEDWLDATWRQPCFARALTTVVIVDGRLAAFSAARTDGGTRYWTVMTGTARASAAAAWRSSPRTTPCTGPAPPASRTRTPATTRATARCWRSTGGSATRSAPRRYDMSANSPDRRSTHCLTPVDAPGQGGPHQDPLPRGAGPRRRHPDHRPGTLGGPGSGTSASYGSSPATSSPSTTGGTGGTR